MRAGIYGVLRAALTLAVAATTLTLTGPGATAAPPPAPPAKQQGERITLVTGDRVEVVRGAAQLVPGKGRQGIGFAETRTKDGRYTVVPSDAMPLLAAGRLDPRLFDVTFLLEAKYGDAHRADLPLIATYTAAKKPIAGAHVVRNLASIEGGAIAAEKAKATTFWNELKSGAGIAKLWLDGPVRASLDQSVPQIGAHTAWKSGYTGKGVKVAVLDTGIDATHPDLDDAIVEAKDFSESGSTIDYFGHGTHVSSIVTGRGDASKGKYKGVAPDAKLLVGKVLDDGGYGYDSNIIAGMEWAAAKGARVVNLSLGSCATDGKDPKSQAVNAMTKKYGTLFVVAAGNHPADPNCFADERVSSPAAADSALAVASVTKQDALSTFSNVGPRLGDHALKPEISAPGQAIVAAKASESGGDPAVRYVQQSGTSMAAPHVAGAAAILAQQHPDWRAPQLRAALMASALPNAKLGVFQQGAGRVDLTKAIRQTVLTEPAGLGFGLARWPHTDDQPSSKRLTYRNTKLRPVTLDLSVTGNAPAGMFKVSPAKVTVPGGKTVGVTVTADTKVKSADGLFGAWITARAGSTLVARTPLGVNKEVESYDLTLRAIDRTGKAAVTQVWLTRPGASEVRPASLNGKPVTVRMPKGTYDLSAPIHTENADPALSSYTIVAQPELKLTKNTVVVLDARKGKKAGAKVDAASAKPQGQYAIWLDNGSLLSRVRGGDDGNVTGVLFAVPTPPVTSYPYTYGFTGTLASATRGYLLHETLAGRIPEPMLVVRDSQLATVRTRLHAEGVDTGGVGHLKVMVAGDSFPVPLGFDVNVPGDRTDLYSARPELGWQSELSTDQTYEYDYDSVAGSSYRPGTKYDKYWGKGALGPAFRPSYAYERLWAGVGEFSSSATGSLTGLQVNDGVTAQNTLRKNGVVIGSNDEPGGGTFDAVDPDEAATYQLTTSATRAVDWSTLATRVDAAWTFKGPFEEFERPSALSVRTAGAFDLLNRAPADRAFPLRVTVENADGTKPKVQRVALRASFDDGTTWTTLQLAPSGDVYWTTVPKPPANAHFVSLRAVAEAADGTKVEQTVIRSYELRR
ncbi:S8 family serine peptidase [Tenggerimyces flavus]|uniref:S8 family serine peptidase n=1 Tax=Tenggerimyces flavus TaxID=1708749 RepID=A0ABV7YKN5_9ACTN|nr:S8 family serine peptidase [Tenggerimyces flavus]MBM7784697.1 subtilisin family serine protease [Tenggerimyces flavus]